MPGTGLIQRTHQLDDTQGKLKRPRRDVIRYPIPHCAP